MDTMCQLKFPILALPGLTRGKRSPEENTRRRWHILDTIAPRSYGAFFERWTTCDLTHRST